jgi:hypothetical protein
MKGRKEFVLKVKTIQKKLLGITMTLAVLSGVLTYPTRSHAILGIVSVNPILIAVGSAVLVGGATAVGFLGKMVSSGRSDGTVALAAIAGIPIFGAMGLGGLVLLPEKNVSSAEFPAFSNKQANALGLSDAEHRTYSMARDRFNQLLEDLSPELGAELEIVGIRDGKVSPELAEELANQYWERSLVQQDINEEEWRVLQSVRQLIQMAAP